MSEYLDRKQVIDLYEKHHSHLATYVWEFGQELKALPTVEPKQGEWIDKVCHIVHSTILTFISEEEGVMSKEELLLLNVNKAICTEIKKLGG